MSSPDRNKLIILHLQRETIARIETQSKFFRLARPDQPVIGPGTANKTEIEDSIREIWKRYGWPGLTKSWMPSTKQIAEKNHIDVLTMLYEYLFRLTSGAVHFDPAILLRTGWGAGRGKSIQFSPKNFDKYYLEYARIYGLLLFCCYFELFAQFLRPDKTVARQVIELRWNLVSEMRWPEMVTHEEMNLDPPPAADRIPRLTFRYVDAVRRKRKLLTTPPDAATTLQHVRRLLAGLRKKDIWPRTTKQRQNQKRSRRR